MEQQEKQEPKQNKPKKIYFGWWIVVVGFLIMALHFAPSNTMPSLFVKPIADDFGVSRTAATAISTVVALASMVVSFFAGHAFVKFGIRRVVVIAVITQALCHFMFAAAGSMLVIYIAAAIRGATIIFSTVLPISILINNWFGSKIRGKAWGITVVGSGAGSVVLSPIAGLIIDNFGWRYSYVFFGILSLCLVPLVLAVFVLRPRDKGLEVLGEEPSASGKPLRVDASGISARNAVRTPMFWVLAVAIFLLSGAMQMWNQGGSAYLQDLGNDIVFVSFLMSISAVGLIIGKILLGAGCDRFGTRFSTSGGLALLFIAYIGALLLGTLPALSYPTMLIFGIGLAVPTVTITLMTRDLFGAKDYGTLAGVTQGCLNAGTSVLTIVASLVYDSAGTYVPAWFGALGVCVLAIVLINLAYSLKPAAMKKYGESQ